MNRRGFLKAATLVTGGLFFNPINTLTGFALDSAVIEGPITTSIYPAPYELLIGDTIFIDGIEHTITSIDTNSNCCGVERR